MECVRHRAITIQDECTRGISYLFESETNNTLGQEHNKIRCFVSPMCVISSTYEDILNSEMKVDVYFRYKFNIINYHDQLLKAAEEKVVEEYDVPRENKKSVTVCRLTHGPLTFTFQEDIFKLCTISGFTGASNLLHDKEELCILVPESQHKAFKSYLNRYQKLPTINVKMYVRIRNVFVKADQVAEILTEALQSNNIVCFQDPEIPDKIVEKSYEIVRSYLNANPLQLSSIDVVKSLQRKIATGLGLDPQNYQPITVMWDVVNMLNEVTNYNQANQKIQQYYNSEQNSEKISVSGKAGFGPFSAKVGYSKEMTRENVNAGYFQNEEEYSEFKQRNYTEVGQQPIITPRGLDLVESTTIRNNLSRVVSSFTFKPTNAEERFDFNAPTISTHKATLFPARNPVLVGAIRDLGCSVTVSSIWDHRHSALHIALYDTPRLGIYSESRDGDSGSWCAQVNDENQWVKVYFGEIVSVHKIAIQGRSDLDQWVTQYKVDYTIDGVTWEAVDDGRVFGGCHDRNTVVTETFTPVLARAIKIKPTSFHNHVSMRCEVYISLDVKTFDVKNLW